MILFALTSTVQEPLDLLLVVEAEPAAKLRDKPELSWSSTNFCHTTLTAPKVQSAANLRSGLCWRPFCRRLLQPDQAPPRFLCLPQSAQDRLLVQLRRRRPIDGAACASARAAEGTGAGRCNLIKLRRAKCEDGSNRCGRAAAIAAAVLQPFRNPGHLRFLLCAAAARDGLR
jgi:hypothetical protein